MERKLALIVVLAVVMGLFIFRKTEKVESESGIRNPPPQELEQVEAGTSELPETSDQPADPPLPIDETGLLVRNLRREGRYVLGIVTDPYDTPVPRARVQAVPDDGGPPYDAVGKDDGSFYIMAPTGVAYKLVIEVSGTPTLEILAP